MSALSFHRSLAEFCAYSLEKDLAINIGAHKIEGLSGGRQRVVWQPVTESEYDRDNDILLSEYLRCLRNGDYSILLCDGALIQISATFDADQIVDSRFYYIPCPIIFKIEDLFIDGDIYPLEDYIIEMSADELKQRICMRAPFRFELDPANAGDGHPLNHVHIGPSSSRIPVSVNLCWDSFARFIFKNFYPDQFHLVQPMLHFPVSYRIKSLSTDLEHEVHLAFSPASLAVVT